VGGGKIDLDSYIAAVKAVDPTEHHDLTNQAAVRKCC
jgi:hypothetical protein